MAIIVKVIEQRKAKALGYAPKDFEPIKVVTFHLPDEALSADGETEGDWLLEAVGVADEAFERVINAETVRKLMMSAGLTEKEKAVIIATFWDDLDDDAIAKTLRLSRSRVRFYRRCAIAKLRHLAHKWGLL